MYGGSSKPGRGGGRGGGGGSSRNRNSFPPPTNRDPSPVGRMSSGGGSSSRQPNSKASASSVEETFSLVRRETPSAFGMIIRLAPELMEEIKRVEAQGETAKINFDAFPNNSTGNIINVGGKEFKFTWSRERGDLCDIYGEHQSGEDGNGVLIEAGCAWRKLNVQRTLDESTTSHMKMRSVEAEQRNNSRKAIVLDPGIPSLTKQLAPEASPWGTSNKQKKEPPPKKRKVDPPTVPVGGPKPSFRPGASSPVVKNRLSASPRASPSKNGNIARRHTAKENFTPVQTKSREDMVAGEKDTSAWENNVIQHTSGYQATIVNEESDLQAQLVDLLREAPMSLKALEKAIGGKIPNVGKKIELILKNIAIFQAPRYFLKSGAEFESYKKPSPDSGSSPEHQQLLPIIPGGSNMEKVSVCEGNGEGSKDCLPVHLAEQLNAEENVDIEHHSPGIPIEEKRSEGREGQARSSSSSSSDSSDSGSSSYSEASSNSKEGSDVEVDIMSDGDKEPQQTIRSAERDAIDLPGHDSDAVDIDGHDSDEVDIDGHDSDAVDVEGNSSDEGHEADSKKISNNNWETEVITSATATENEEVGISGQEQMASGHDKLRERQNLIGQLFDDTENTTTKGSLKGDQPDISEVLANDQNQKAPDLEHYSQKPARVKNKKSQSFNQLPATGKKSRLQEHKDGVELLNASASQTIDPLREIQKPFTEMSSRHGQVKPVDSSGKSNKHSDKGDMLSGRPGKTFRDNRREDVHNKNKFPRTKVDGDAAFRPSLPSDTSNRKRSEVDGSEKDPKNGPVLQKQVSELELGELPERLGEEDTSMKELEEKSSYKQPNLKPSTSDKRRSKKPDPQKSAPSLARNGIKDCPEHVAEDSERSQKQVLQPHGQNLTGTDTEAGSHNKHLEDASYKSRQLDSRARVGSSLEGYGETNKRTNISKNGSKRASTSRSSRESKRHATTSTMSYPVNGHKDATTSIPGDSVVREKRKRNFDQEDSSYLKYEKASPELKGPISDHSQYKAYMQEYMAKYDSYCSVNKILESHRNDFQKLGQDLEFAKGKGMKRYIKTVEEIRETYCIYGERHKRLKKVFVVLHEELKQLKQRMKDYASSH